MLEAKAILNYMGIPDSEAETLDMDTLKQKFESQFIKRDIQAIKDDKEIFSKVTAAYNEINKGKLKKALKETGYEFGVNELDPISLPEAIETYIPKVVKGKAERIAELEKAALEGNDKKYQQLKTEYEQFKSQAEPLEQKYNSLAKEYDEYKVKSQNEFTNFKIGDYVNKAWDKFKWATGANEFEKKGFKNEIEQKYKTVLGDDGNFITTDAQGNRIKDESKAGQFKSLDQILEMEGVEANKKGAKIFGVAQDQPVRQQPKTVNFGNENKDTPVDPRRKMNTATRPQAV